MYSDKAEPLVLLPVNWDEDAVNGININQCMATTKGRADPDPPTECGKNKDNIEGAPDYHCPKRTGRRVCSDLFYVSTSTNDECSCCLENPKNLTPADNSRFWYRTYDNVREVTNYDGNQGGGKWKTFQQRSISKDMKDMVVEEEKFLSCES